MARDEPREMQLYLDRPVAQDKLLPLLASLLGIAVETLDRPDPEARAFAMFTPYEHGFPLGVSISWAPDLSPRLGAVDVALALARRLGTLVATDLPDTVGKAGVDPYRWSVARPDGTLVEMTEDLRSLEANGGLRLDPHSVRPLPDGSRQPVEEDAPDASGDGTPSTP